MTAKTLVATTAVLITRDAMTIIPTELPAHEIEIAKAVFGEENVNPTGADSGAVELEAASEAERLEQKWGSDALQAAFGANYKGKIAKAVADGAVKPSEKKAKGE
jgi:hypothetical protein